MKRVVLCGASVLLIGALSGCVTQPDLVPELSETAQSDDTLPVEVDELDGLELDESTVRYVGTEEDWRVFIARSVASDDVTAYCLVAFSAEDEHQGACANSLPVQISPLDGPTFWFTGSTGTTPTGFEELSRSVFWKSEK